MLYLALSLLLNRFAVHVLGRRCLLSSSFESIISIDKRTQHTTSRIDMRRRVVLLQTTTIIETCDGYWFRGICIRRERCLIRLELVHADRWLLRYSVVSLPLLVTEK